MAYPAGFASDDEDEFDGFLSDGSTDAEYRARRIQQFQQGVQENPTPEQKLTSMFFAVMNGNLEQVISDLDEGLDINADLRDGWTPLLLAASTGNSDVVRELINRGADVNADRDKYTVLMAACSCSESSLSSKCLDIVMQLIEKGAVVDAITKKRKTALMFAASNGNVEVVAKLLAYGEVGAEDNQGWNALFWAANDNKPEVVQVLLEAGLNPDKVDIRGNTPLYYAVSQEHEEVIKLLSPEPDNIVIANMQETFDQFESLFDNQKPQFYRDICCMLYGMKCESLSGLFVNISLSDFLTLNEEKLVKLGIIVPFQRHRILTGLHKFHRQLYKQKSIPVVPKNCLYSTIDVSNAVLSAVKQIIAMESSLRYICDTSLDTGEDKNPFCVNIISVRNKIVKLKKTVNRLSVLAQTWDASNQPVDLITKNSRKRNNWRRWFGFTSLLLLTAVAASRVQLH